MREAKKINRARSKVIIVALTGLVTDLVVEKGRDSGFDDMSKYSRKINMLLLNS